MTQEQQNFINEIGNAALQYYPIYKILPSMTIAQAIKESFWNKSKLSTECFNFYGMKWVDGCGCDYKEYSTKEWDKATKSYITVKAKFRKYKNAAEGIRGYYDFISGYKRYSNLKGVTDSFTACKLIAADGWATDPRYGNSLFNDYVIPYNLLAWDMLALTGEPLKVEDEPYSVGKVYMLDANMYVRDVPNGQKLKFESLTLNAKMHGIYDQYGNGILQTGTKVTCRQVNVLADGSIWLLIPSGWVCAKDRNRIYIK